MSAYDPKRTSLTRFCCGPTMPFSSHRIHGSHTAEAAMKYIGILLASARLAAPATPVAPLPQGPQTSTPAPENSNKPGPPHRRCSHAQGDAPKGGRAATEAVRLSQTGQGTKGAAAQASGLC